MLKISTLWRKLKKIRKKTNTTKVGDKYLRIHSFCYSVNLTATFIGSKIARN